MTRLQRVALVAILLVATALRLTGLDWDGLEHHHPDERYITWVATTIEFSSLGNPAAWQPAQSTFNPFRWPAGARSEGIVVLQDQPRDFAYGHLPLYLGVAATRLVERLAPVLVPLLPAGWSLTADVLNGAGRIEFHHLVIVGRLLTALFDVGTVLLVFLLGRSLYRTTVGLLAAALLTFTVLHIQLSHFFTTDPYLTFFVVAALYAMVRARRSSTDPVREREQPAHGTRSIVWLTIAALAVGLAIGSKATAVLLILPLTWTGLSTASGRRRWAQAVGAVVLALAVFALTNPFAVLDWTCPPPDDSSRMASMALPEALTRSCFLQNLAMQNAMARGRLDLGFTRQYDGTWPYLYFMEMQIRWGMGLLLGILAFTGLGWVLMGTFRAMGHSASDGPNTWRDALSRFAAQSAAIPLLWVVPYFVLTGGLYVKFMRYMQPVVPLLVIFGAALLLGDGTSSSGSNARLRWRLVPAAVVLVFTSLYALAFSAVYHGEHPWNSASRWIHENVPPGTLILSEQWDDFLPVTMMVDGQLRRREDYPNRELTWLSLPDMADDEAKLKANLDLLSGAEYVTVLSNRIYGVVPRLPGRYPLSSQYHQLLFDGKLGYELVWAAGRFPKLFGLAIRPDTFGWPGLRPPATLIDPASAAMSGEDSAWPSPAISFGRVDESFVVYDQPLTLIFRNTGRLSSDQMLALFRNPPGR